MSRPTTPPIERFMKYVFPITEAGCWIWTGAISRRYGLFRLPSKSIKAHRFSYEFHVGRIPKGFFIDHTCRVSLCVNPAHLRAVTPRINAIENNCGPTAINSIKTHCKRGHEFTPDNTRLYNGSRRCKKCEREQLKIRRINQHE